MDMADELLISDNTDVDELITLIAVVFCEEHANILKLACGLILKDSVIKERAKDLQEGFDMLRGEAECNVAKKKGKYNEKININNNGAINNFSFCCRI